MEASFSENDGKVNALYQAQDFSPLMTVHNISQENLVRANDLGGLAVPSLGIRQNPTCYLGGAILVSFAGSIPVSPFGK